MVQVHQILLQYAERLLFMASSHQSPQNVSNEQACLAHLAGT